MASSDTRGDFADSSVRDFLALAKPNVMGLSVFTGGIALFIAPGTLHIPTAFFVIIALIIGSAGAGALNMWYERDIDAKMHRTAGRPLPRGRIEPSEAAAFGVILSMASVMVMGLATNWLAAGLLATAILFYVSVYTMWLKPLTPMNIVIGGAAGAFPPMIGWAAITGSISLESFALFMVIFLWTPPHFWALALYCRDDYKRAKLPMLPLTHGEKVTRRQILYYTVTLFAASLLPFFVGQAGLGYLLVAIILGSLFLLKAWAVFREKEGVFIQARALFRFSILYLFLLFSVLAFDRFLQGVL